MCRNSLATLGGRSSFEYSGSVPNGTRIWYGKNNGNTFFIPKETYEKLLTELAGVVKVGNSRRNRPAGSLGAWLKEHLTGALIAAHVAKILVQEGYAVKEKGPVLRLK